MCSIRNLAAVAYSGVNKKINSKFITIQNRISLQVNATVDVVLKLSACERLASRKEGIFKSKVEPYIESFIFGIESFIFGVSSFLYSPERKGVNINLGKSSSNWCMWFFFFLSECVHVIKKLENVMSLRKSNYIHELTGEIIRNCLKLDEKTKKQLKWW